MAEWNDSYHILGFRAGARIQHRGPLTVLAMDQNAPAPCTRPGAHRGSWRPAEHPKNESIIGVRPAWGGVQAGQHFEKLPSERNTETLAKMARPEAPSVCRTRPTAAQRRIFAGDGHRDEHVEPLRNNCTTALPFQSRSPAKLAVLFLESAGRYTREMSSCRQRTGFRSDSTRGQSHPTASTPANHRPLQPAHPGHTFHEAKCRMIAWRSACQRDQLGVRSNDRRNPGTKSWAVILTSHPP